MSKIQVKIPASLVPRAKLDYDAEAAQIIGQDLILSDGFRIPALTPARLIALELVSSEFFMHPGTCDALDAAAAIVLCSCQRSMIQELTTAAPRAGAEPGTSEVQAQPGGVSAYPYLQKAAASWLAAHAVALKTDYARVCSWLLDVPFYGFSMRPGGDSGRAKYFIFDGVFVGGVLAPAAKLLATPLEMILWETPLCAIGHAIAQQDAALGVKGIERPPDLAALDRMMAEAEQRERTGLLHEWQYMDPVHYPLTETQANANPELIPLFEEIREAFLKSGGKPVDPAQFPVTPFASREACDSPLERRDVSPTAEVQAQPGACPAQGQNVNEDIGFYV